MQKRAEPAHCWYRSLPAASWHSGTNPACSPRTPRPVSSGSFSNLISSLSPSCHCGSCHTGLLAGPGTQGVRVFTLAPSYIPFVTLSGSLFKCYLLREPLTILCKTAPQLPHTTHCACALLLRSMSVTFYSAFTWFLLVPLPCTSQQLVSPFQGDFLPPPNPQDISTSNFINV